ncbi:import receptor subunit tom20, putative [Ixodes scapularis]|uniref:Import receptor subunit tom20, putative n=1 Tax=Ixodes scapularis TaxID=6945 RepID=B7PHS9_IXOSC|nr:import receptor subunit tom20, putative [Ixodes scapularis]|eukprot:XP_002403495.1 import receptor subunit tom20, putative [Ixodes scapularis]
MLQVDAVTESLEDIALVEGGLPKQSRTSKAEKRREKKRQMDAQREKEIAEQEVKNQFLPRAVEDRAFKTLLAQQRLAIHEVPSDGNCMYKAVEHQLHLVGTKKSMKTLRRDAAEYMLANAEEFLPFLTSASSGGVMTREEFEEYCDKVSGTTTWGGQLELPDLKDYEAVQKFFIHEVQMGEELLAQGDVENGVEHLSSAVAVCGQPQQLLQVLQQTLPPQVFHLLLQRLPIVSQTVSCFTHGSC